MAETDPGTEVREEVRARCAAAAATLTAGASVAFTHEVAPGLHGAIVRATKPGAPARSATSCCAPAQAGGCGCTP